MRDLLGSDLPSETATAWDTVRRVREPIAWAIIVLTAILVVVSAWQLFGLPGVTVIVLPTPATLTFAMRASVVAPQFVEAGLITMPILAVILVAFAGGLTDRARQVVQAAAWVQAVTLALGVLSWLGALSLAGAGEGLRRTPIWFVSDATYLAVAAAALIFTVAVSRSQALRPPQEWQEFDDDPEGAGDDV